MAVPQGTLVLDTAPLVPTYYVRAGASGSGTGADWTNAYTTLPAALTRGAMYYVADGSYATYTCDDAESGTSVITVKKATVADHGTNVGWLDSYGDGQAVFADNLTFSTGYYVFDGNGTHTVPSANTNDYGFKINSTSLSDYSGIVRFGSTVPVSNIVLKYTHVYNPYTAADDSGTVGLRFYPTQAQTYIKVQNCYLQNCGKDGIQITASHHILVERCYIERYGKMYDPSHGQTVQVFELGLPAGHDLIFRWNVWRSCEGQALLSWDTMENLRFYGNIVFSPYNTVETNGFNSGGGLCSGAWATDYARQIYIYNNTVVNQRNTYALDGSTVVGFPIHAGIVSVADLYCYNNLFFNCENSTAPRYTSSHHASGGYGTAGGTSEQTGLASSIFQDYEADNYRLTSATTAGKDVSAESWFDTTPDGFWSTLDSVADMDGNERSAWCRGAFEYVP